MTQLVGLMANAESNNSARAVLKVCFPALPLNSAGVKISCVFTVPGPKADTLDV